MAREIVTHVLCDACLADDQRTEAEELPPVTIGSRKARVLALCEPHRKELFDPFEQALTELGQLHQSEVAGRPPAIVSDESRKAACMVCGKRLKNMKSIAQHLRNNHDMTLTEARARYGETYTNGEPLPEAEQLPLPVDGRITATCSECGYETKPTKNPRQALGVHMAKTHGIRGGAHRP